MQYSSLAVAIAAIPAILAIPHNHGHHPDSSISASAASAPYGQSNVSVGATGTGTGVAQYSTVRLQSTNFYTASSSSTAAPSEAATEAGGSDAGSCGSLVTVTVGPPATVTVTVNGNGNGAPAQSSVAASSAPVVVSSAGPIVSASAKPSTSAPVTTSATPLASSTGSAEGLTPSKVSDSAAGASNVAPVQSYSAPATSSVAPVKPSSAVSIQASSAAPVQSSSAAPNSAPAASPSATVPVAASGVASSDYCKNTFKIDPKTNELQDAITNEPFHYAGANYTGGVKGKKRGIVFVAAIPEQAALVQYANDNPSIHWLGNYYSAPPSEYKDMKFEFVPQMYGRQSVGQEWNTNAARAVKAGVKNFLSFGEAGTPNEKNHQEPADAAQTFIEQMQPYAGQGVTIGAPGSLGAPQDLKWEQDLLCSCQGKGCSIGFQTGHWFDAAAPLDNSVTRAKATVEAYIAVARGKPVWFENIWAKGTAAEQKAFMDVMVPWLEDNAAIERYGWVPLDDRPQDGDPFTSGGAATDIAKHFASL